MAVFQNTSSNIVTTVANGTGTLSLVGNLWTSANAYIAGDLTVDGNVTYINISELNVEDPIISLGRGPNNTPLTGNDGKDRGTDMWYYTTVEKSSFVGYQNATGNIIAATDVSIASEIVTVNTWGTLQAGRFYGDDLLVTSASIIGNVDAGNLQTTGIVTATGNITGGNVLTGGLITATGNITGANLITSGIVTASGNITTASSVHVDGLVFVEGLITAVGNVIAANFNTNGVASVGGNVIGGNITTAGVVTATGNITGANFDTAGLITAAGNITSANVNTAGLITAGGNITGANFDTTGLITAVGNIVGGNITTSNLATLGTVNMTNDVNWAQTGKGLVWAMNTDAASIKFYNTGDGDTDSRLEFNTADNTNEYFRWTHTSGTTYESMRLVPNTSGDAVLTVSGQASATGNITGAWLIGNGSQITSISSSALPLATKTDRGAIVGEVNSQIALGTNAGFTNQGTYGVAVGFNAAANTQGYESVAVGYLAGSQAQDHQSIAIGTNAGYQSQGLRAIAMGVQAGYSGQGQYSIAMGFEAGFSNQANNSIILNAVASQLNASQSGLYIAPVRNDVSNIINPIFYNTTTKEITYANAISLTGNVASGNITATGNVSGANIDAISLISAGGNITAANFNTGGLVTAAGNVYGANVVGVIRPTSGTGLNGIVFPADPGGGGGDLATIQYYAASGESTVLELAVTNDPDDIIKLNASGGISVVGALSTSSLISAAGNITGSNINTAGLITATGNVYGNNVNATGLSLSGNVLSTINTTSNITTTANIAGGNLNISGNITGNTSGYQIGYLNIPQVSLSSNVTAALTDSGKHYYSTSASDVSLTVPNNSTVSWPVGSTITVINQGTANIIVTQDSGVSVYLGGNSTAGNRTISSYGLATLINVTANVWFINGAGVA